MKKRPSAKWIIVLAGGAAAAALSFLLAGIENEGVRGFRWALFAIGVAAAVLSAVVLVVGSLKRDGRRLLPEGAEYRKKRTLMSPPERELYELLTKLLDRRAFAVLPQTALVSVIDKVSGGGYRNELFRIADFCIVDAGDFEPLVLVELNDASHLRDDRRLRDEKVAAICSDAGIPLVTFTLEQAKNAKYVRNELSRRL